VVSSGESARAADGASSVWPPLPAQTVLQLAFQTARPRPLRWFITFPSPEHLPMAGGRGRALPPLYLPCTFPVPSLYLPMAGGRGRALPPLPHSGACRARGARPRDAAAGAARRGGHPVRSAARDLERESCALPSIIRHHGGGEVVWSRQLYESRVYIEEYTRWCVGGRGGTRVRTCTCASLSVSVETRVRRECDTVFVDYKSHTVTDRSRKKDQPDLVHLGLLYFTYFTTMLYNPWRVSLLVSLVIRNIPTYTLHVHVHVH